jgi:hypothetical protein
MNTLFWVDVIRLDLDRDERYQAKLSANRPYSPRMYTRSARMLAKKTTGSPPYGFSWL